jgi:tRNA-Thr(GGU) m(6)t(6)A37 methyltransferase TsaA
MARRDEAWTVRAIGVVHSPFRKQTGTPVQPALAGDDAVGTVEVFSEFAEGLCDVEGFDRLWLLSWLDRSGPVRMKVVPYLDTTERGLFATRAPSRPNPIGLSAVRLLRRAANILHVADLDLLDGTPLLDIKPYAPQIDVFDVGRAGWLAGRRGPSSADDRFEPD